MPRELYFPFNAEEIGNEEFDRVWDAEDFAKYFALFVGNGIYPNPSNNLKVVANGNMNVTVSMGTGFIKGHGYILFEPYTIRVNNSNPSSRRTDAIFLQLDNKERWVQVVYKAGSLNAPAITRNDDIWELKLAEITVNADAISISQADILDTRLDGKVCGVVSCVVNSVDTTKLFEQYDEYLKRKQREWDQIQQQEQGNWQNQLNNQQTIWNEQMNNQSNDYANFKLDMEAWLASVKIDLPRYASFDFDNLSAYIGSKAEVEFLSNGNINETLKNNFDNTLVAERSTEFLADGNIKVSETVYHTNGRSVLRKSTKVTTFNGYKITEVIS